jgi:hypothetical protein
MFSLYFSSSLFSHFIFTVPYFLTLFLQFLIFALYFYSSLFSSSLLTLVLQFPIAALTLTLTPTSMAPDMFDVEV